MPLEIIGLPEEFSALTPVLTACAANISAISCLAGPRRALSRYRRQSLVRFWMRALSCRRHLKLRPVRALAADLSIPGQACRLLAVILCQCLTRSFARAFSLRRTLAIIARLFDYLFILCQRTRGISSWKRAGPDDIAYCVTQPNAAHRISAINFSS
jgi:hypothetical protein